MVVICCPLFSIDNGTEWTIMRIARSIGAAATMLVLLSSVGVAQGGSVSTAAKAAATKTAPTKSSAKKAAAIKAAAAQMTVPSVIDSSLSAVRPQSAAPTPSVIGQSKEEAARRLKIAELRWRGTTMKPSPDTALGSVLAQDPAPGDPIRPDRSIDLTIAGVPDVSGRSLADATNAIERAHLRVGSTTSKETEDGQDNVVLEQSPAAGDSAQPQTAVDLVVARVIARLPMPKLIGRTVGEAQASADSAGLVIGSIQTADAEGKPDTVTEQTPQPGTMVRAGDTVTLVKGRPITLGARVPRGTGVAVDTAVPRAATANGHDDSWPPWWQIALIAAGLLGLGLFAFLRPDPDPDPVVPPAARPAKPPAPPPPPLMFDYKYKLAEEKTDLSAPTGHGPELALVSHAGESEHAVKPYGVKLIDEENSHG